MIYLSGKAQKKRKYIRYGICAVIFVIVVYFWPAIRKVSFGIIEPAVVGYSNTKKSFSFFPEFFSTYLTSHQTLATRQKVLELEIERLENALADKDALLRERDGSIDVRTSSSLPTSRVLTLYPLMEDITKVYSTVLLSKGFKDGIAVGSLVYLRGDQVVCIIKEVYIRSSLCSLLSSSGEVVEGVTSSSSIVLSLVGRGGHFLADVVRDTPVQNGEIVYLRSNPRMIIGTIRQVANNNQDTSWHVFVEGAYNPANSSVFYVQAE